jgi:hypothetical protein
VPPVSKMAQFAAPIHRSVGLATQFVRAKSDGWSRIRRGTNSSRRERLTPFTRDLFRTAENLGQLNIMARQLSSYSTSDAWHREVRDLSIKVVAHRWTGCLF